MRIYNIYNVPSRWKGTTFVDRVCTLLLIRPAVVGWYQIAEQRPAPTNEGRHACIDILLLKSDRGKTTFSQELKCTRTGTRIVDVSSINVCYTNVNQEFFFKCVLCKLLHDG